ncbi:MAG: hypothetical protein JWM61_2859 [Micrococcaceae bacterium]|nr:hypothetical protein [Micrococcaceae bacterium]
MTRDSAAASTPADVPEKVDESSTDPSTYADRVLGCLLGTMAGDAYGVLHAVGDDPSAALGDPAALAVSDATQLTLYTVDGLVDALEWANDGVAADETACLWLAYLRWLVRQGEHLPANAPAPPGRWLDRQDDLLPVHDPDADTVRALLTGAMGTRSRPLNPQAEGAGALMRSAPFGMVPRIPASMVERLTVDAAALTHGSPAARGTAALFSGLIRSLAIDELTLDEAVRVMRGEEDRLAHTSGHDDGTSGVTTGATAPTASGGPAARVAPGAMAGTIADATTTGSRADATTAAGTFEAALQAVLEGASESSSPQDHLAAALAHASSAGRPDASSTVAASVAGAIVGALHGTRALPASYRNAEGMPAVVRGMARTLVRATTGS